MSTSAPRPPLFILMLLSCLAVLPINLFLPSLPHIADEFQVDYAIVNLSVAGFGIAAGVAQLVAGPLSDWYGRRPVALAAALIFVAASIGCMVAPSIETFLFFRIVQSIVVVGYGVSLAVIKETSDGREAASRIGYVATAYAIVPMIGPALGGFLDQLFGWRSSFLLFSLCGVLVFLLVFRRLTETNSTPAQSLATYAAGYKQLLGSVRFWAYTSCMAFSIGTLYVFLGAVPLMAGRVFEISPASVGILMGVVPGGFMLGSFLSGRYASRNVYGINVLTGRLITFAGLLAGLVMAWFEIGHVLAFFGPCMCIGLGNGLTMPSANAGAMSVRPDLAGSAAGLASAVTLAGGALVAALAGLFYNEANTIIALLSIMLAVSILGVFAAMLVLIDDRRRSAMSF